MNREEVLEALREAMPEKRFIHTLGVEKTALELADHYKIDRDQASTAALLHDYAKYMNKEEMMGIMVEQKMDPKLFTYNQELWHAPVGAFFAKTKFGVEDEVILSAIACHTTGNAAMSTLDKILYLADYTEPNRSFPGVYKARRLSFDSLDNAMLFALSNTITFLVTKRQPIFPDTFEAYNYFARLQFEGEV
ncbi:bis(5'-nucleosyl)-tetraphosphatase (symmetrical) YqeK [Listeria grandensis]|uniref:bis(5'-nucleosyl)-tetraphosphatase (symmetrical) YqeK n=1 Tax=Listeria grandensis TaxID=1494963 RepID=UPI00164DCECA|nr:bis(5'-nucleosyl)-tetraphosphatase (symmetrical) YqeK [Listeria grandensis]MBC6315377.1 HD domain-containing protein [Listeria grandensis]